MFKDSKEGQTHYFGDGCKPPHITAYQENVLKEFDKIPHGGAISPRGDYVTVVNAKEFIFTALQGYAKHLIEEIGKLDKVDYDHDDYEEIAFNQGLSEAQEVIRKEIR